MTFMHDDSLFHALRGLPPIAEMLNRHANGELEQALLGTILMHPGAFGKTVGRVVAEDFADDVHVAIFQEIAARVGVGQGVGHLLLGDVADACDAELQDLGGGRRYLADLVSSAAPLSFVPSYADQVHEYAQRRRAIDASVRTIAAAAHADQAAPVIAGALAELEALVESGGGRSRAQVLAEMVASMEKPSAIYSTGYPSIDRRMAGGLHVGRVYGLAGVGKAGKSSLAGGISYNLNVAGVRHAYIALEMGPLEIEQRQVARDLGTNSMALLGHTSNDTVARVGVYAATAADHVWYVDMPGGTFERLRTEVTAARYRHRCAGAIIDYWQLVSGRAGSTSEEEHLRRVAEWLAAAAKRLKIWILLLAQLADDGQATAICRTGLNRNVDQLFFLRGDLDTEFRWLEMKATRYTPKADVGSERNPALRLTPPGPHFLDLTATPEEHAHRGLVE